MKTTSTMATATATAEPAGHDKMILGVCFVQMKVYTSRLAH
jgi:hypothetical protein